MFQTKSDPLHLASTLLILHDAIPSYLKLIRTELLANFITS